MENPSPPSGKYNAILLLLCKFIRMFSFGTLSVPIIMYLQQLGLNTHQIGMLMTIILIGNFIVNWIFTSRADKMGRKKTLILSGFLKLITGIIFSMIKNYYILCVVGMIGVISVTGGETGPFFPIQQAVLSDIAEVRCKEKGQIDKIDSEISKMMGWYNFFGFTGFALGCGFVGYFIKVLKRNGLSEFAAHQFVMFGYALWGFVLVVLYRFLNEEVEAIPPTQKQLAPPQQKFNWTLSMIPSVLGFDSARTLKLISIMGVFMVIDSFAGYLTPNSFYSLWYDKQWHISSEHIGIIMMVCSIASGVGAFIASLLVSPIGIVPIMIGTHIPSLIFLILIPIMPTKILSIVMCVLKSFSSNMNLSARQTYIMSLVKSDEKSAANGIMGMSRTLGSIFSPMPLSHMINEGAGSFKFSLPFYLNGSIKFVLDLLLLLFYVIIERKRKERGREGEGEREREKAGDEGEGEEVKIQLGSEFASEQDTQSLKPK